MSVLILVGAVGFFVIAALIAVAVVLYANSSKRSADIHQPAKPKVPPTTAELKELESISPDIIKALEKREKILAIKLYREETGCDLRDAKEYIEDIQDRLF